MAEMLNATDFALDFMLSTAGVNQPTEDGKTVSAIAGRIFNTSAGCLQVGLNGY